MKLSSESIKKMIHQCTLEEKVSLCSGANFWSLVSIDRLGVPSIMLADGPHGLRKQENEGDHLGLNKSVVATCFPTAVTLASSWDRELLHSVGEALGREARHHRVSVLLGPGVNLKRHPACGRNFEYFSEDPLLAGELATAYINGVQACGVGTSLKHFAVNNQEFHRMITDVIVDERTLREFYLRPFEIAVKQSAPLTVMCAYNRVNGTYCSDSQSLLTEILRKEWGFEGVVVSDWGAVNDRVEGIKAGLDLEMPASGGVHDDEILSAIHEGRLQLEELDEVVGRLLHLIQKTAIEEQATFALDLEAHHQLAHRAASESIVLLKNEDHLLPLRPNQSIGIIGEFAKKPRYQGAGSSQVNPSRMENAYQAMTTMVDDPAILYAVGYENSQDHVSAELLTEAKKVAKQVEVVLLFVGLPDIFESEGFDRDTLEIPVQHQKLIEAVSEVNHNTVVILNNGSPVLMNWSERPKAIIEAYLGGQASGSAIADVLFGKVNPCGKLAETFPLQQKDFPADTHFPGNGQQVQYREGLYVGYRYFQTAQKEVQYPFGHGLSYTEFEYSNLILSATSIKEQEPLHVRITITNIGQRDGHEIVQIYVHSGEGVIHRPAQQLVGFSKVFVAVGEAKDIDIMLDEKAFSHYDVKSQSWQTESGVYTISAAASVQDIRLQTEVIVHSDFIPEPESKLIQETYHRQTEKEFFVSDEAFGELLGKSIPLSEPIHPFHRNSSLRDIRRTVLGRIVYDYVVRRSIQEFANTEIDEVTRQMIRKSIDGLPLRGLVLFNQGKINFTVLDTLIAFLNGKYLGGIRKLFELIK